MVFDISKFSDLMGKLDDPNNGGSEIVFNGVSDGFPVNIDNMDKAVKYLKSNSSNSGNFIYFSAFNPTPNDSSSNLN